MTIEDIEKEIESKFRQTERVVKITFKDGKTIYGAFEVFEDYTVLKQKHKYRFVPSEMRKEFNRAFRKTDKPNKSYSIIIACADIGKIQFV